MSKTSTFIALTFLIAVASAGTLRNAQEPERELLSDDAEALMDMLMHLHNGGDHDHHDYDIDDIMDNAIDDFEAYTNAGDLETCQSKLDDISDILGHGDNARRLSDTDTIFQEGSAKLKSFSKVFLPLARRTPDSKELRRGEWQVLDLNGNGHVSLAELGRWIQIKLEKANGEDYGKLLYKRFYPAYIRAFLDAADFGKNKAVGGTKTATTDDYVQFQEFRLLNNYLVIYAGIYDIFAVIDGRGIDSTDDGRISLDEVSANLNTAKNRKSPFVAIRKAAKNLKKGKNTAEEILSEMDADGKGKVLLNEFSNYIEKAEIAANTNIGKLMGVGENHEMDK